MVKLFDPQPWAVVNICYWEEQSAFRLLPESPCVHAKPWFTLLHMNAAAAYLIITKGQVVPSKFWLLRRIFAVRTPIYSTFKLLVKR